MGVAEAVAVTTALPSSSVRRFFVGCTSLPSLSSLGAGEGKATFWLGFSSSFSESESELELELELEELD